MGKTIRCKLCTYRIDKLELNRCPECGAGFDPETGRNLKQPEPKRLGGRLFILSLICVLCLAAYLVYLKEFQ